MGKEQELLDAARTGNITVVEKILSSRAKKAGPLAPLASLRRSANPNCRDATGYTPLHHASLNGHKDVVQLLLCYEASANIIDSKGCYPIHLAAWNGNSEICRILLTHGPSTAKVNEQNNDGDTPLHCASQYGHADTVAVLLEYHAEPVIRNFKDESPLDLAAQYGRLETVQLLLRKHPNLLRDRVEQHGPLHLASRNGHKQVVCVLLEAGLDINIKTECGTALHEAALFGKQDVVKLLLENGIDPHLTDGCNRTPLEVISEHKSQISLDIGKIISDYVEGRKNPSQRSSFGTGSSSSISTRHSVGEGLYDNVPPPKPLRSAASSSSSLPSSDLNTRPFHFQRREFIHDRPYDHRDRESVVSEGSICVHESPLLPQRPFSDPLEGLDYDQQALHAAAIAKCAFDSPKSDVSSHSANSSFASSSGLPSPLPSVIMSRASPKGSPRNSPTLRMPGVNVSPDTPKKPPRRKKEGRSSMRFDPDCKKLIANERNLSSSKESLSKLSQEENKNQETEKNEDGSKCDNRLAEEKKEPSLKEKSVLRDVRNSLDLEEKKDEKRDAEKDVSDEKSSWRISAIAEDGNALYTSSGIDSSDSSRETVKLRSSDGETQSKSENETRRLSEGSTSSSRPPSLDFSSKRSSRELGPLSPSGYEQPPTPDHPPPSPMTAIIGIQEKINPREKRRSRDMETITELEFLAEEIGKLTKTTSKDAVTEPLEASTAFAPPLEGATGQDNVEIVNGNDPFLGLTKGSVAAGQRRVKSQIYDNLVIEKGRTRTGSSGAKHKQKRISAPGLFLHFDPLEEEEERKVSKPVARSHSDRHVTTRPKVPPPPPPRMDSASHLVSSVVDSYHNNSPALATFSSTTTTSTKTTSTGTDADSPIIDENAEWAKIAEILSSYGGNMGDSDTNECYSYFEDRILKIFQTETGRMQTVGEWLENLGLSQYENTFVANGFDDIDFMGPNVLEESDLIEMNIDSDEHRQSILRSIASLPSVKSIDEAGIPESVSQWLHSLRLSEYQEVFDMHGYSSMDRVRNLWELELSSVLDMKILGHRKRILASLRTDDERWNQESSTDNSGDWRHDSVDAEDEAEESPLEKLSLFRDYTQLRSRGDDTSEDALSDELVLDNGLDFDSPNKEPNINIRPPHLAHAESPIKQWRHRPEVLINGCCNYAAQYLGSTVVKQLHGTESTKESINKLKKSAETLGKSPVILLSISYKGVKFVDIKSKKLICEHEIGNIFCACQDGDHMNHFAYITKDLETHRHYCHVFSVKSTELATEIILTLGEAFEIAFQIAVREKQEDERPLELSAGSEQKSEEDALPTSSSSSSTAPPPPPPASAAAASSTTAATAATATTAATAGESAQEPTTAST